jgi:hypothetical protein
MWGCSRAEETLAGQDTVSLGTFSFDFSFLCSEKRKEKELPGQ